MRTHRSRRNTSDEPEPFGCDWALTDKDTPFRYLMHYSDPDASGEPITVFGQARKGLFYNYSDRLYGKEWNEGWAKAKEAGLKPNTARFVEAVLNHFHGSTDVDLQHILLGVNRSTGYHYLVYGYTYTSKKEAP
jgi:hypothetical protein